MGFVPPLPRMGPSHLLPFSSVLLHLQLLNTSSSMKHPPPHVDIKHFQRSFLWTPCVSSCMVCVFALGLLQVFTFAPLPNLYFTFLCKHCFGTGSSPAPIHLWCLATHPLNTSILKWRDESLSSCFPASVQTLRAEGPGVRSQVKGQQRGDSCQYLSSKNESKWQDLASLSKSWSDLPGTLVAAPIYRNLKCE